MQKISDPIKPGTFAEACYDGNQIFELIEALSKDEVDKTACNTWLISPKLWRMSIANALYWKILKDDIEEYHFQPSCQDGFDFNNLEWDRMEYEDYAERLGMMVVGVARL